MRLVFISVLFALAAGCVDIQLDPDETVDALRDAKGPVVEFDLEARIVPFPNELIAERGVVSLPEQCNESETARDLRVGVLNELDGFGLYRPKIVATFSEAIAKESLTGRVRLYRYEKDGVLHTPVLVPSQFRLAQEERFDGDCRPMPAVAAVRIEPDTPLDENSRYVGVVLSGVETTAGEPFSPSPTWAFIRQHENPIVLEDGEIVFENTPLDPRDPDAAEIIRGLHRVWGIHAQGLSALDETLASQREEVLVAFSFKTQEIRLGDIARNVPRAPLQNVVSLTEGKPKEYLTSVLGTAACALLGCSRIGEVFQAELHAPQYRQLVTNPLKGAPDIPTSWSPPLAPRPVLESPDAVLKILVSVPNPAVQPVPENGYPVIIFGHGIDRLKEDMLAIAPQLAHAGFVVVAGDLPNHGSRSVPILAAGGRDCSADAPQKEAPHCFAPFLTSKLARVRDNFQQAATDFSTLVQALKACAPDQCGPLSIDPDRIGYLGFSLGAFVGGLTVAVNSDIKAAVLTGGGAGLLDIIENSRRPEIRCGIVDSLIRNGIIVGELSDLTDENDRKGTCIGNDWTSDPGWQKMAPVARWILDKGDPVHYASLMRDRNVLLQEIVGDLVIPNAVTEQLGERLEARMAVADPGALPFGSARLAPSKAIGEARGPIMLAYRETGKPAPTVYSHTALMLPDNFKSPHVRGMVRLQSDAIGYFVKLFETPDAVKPPSFFKRFGLRSKSE